MDDCRAAGVRLSSGASVGTITIMGCVTGRDGLRGPVSNALSILPVAPEPPGSLSPRKRSNVATVRSTTNAAAVTTPPMALCRDQRLARRVVALCPRELVDGTGVDWISIGDVKKPLVFSTGISAIAAINASESAPAVAYRSDGRLASAFSITGAILSGRSLTTTWGAGGNSLRCLSINAKGVGASKGSFPVSMV